MVSSGRCVVVRGVPAFEVATICNLSFSSTSHAQPLPNWSPAALTNCWLKDLWLPKDDSITCAMEPRASPPPPGRMLRQRNAWFHAWAEALNSAGFFCALARTTSSSSVVSGGVEISERVFAT